MSVVYFTDLDLGLQFPKILEDAGLAVERHRDHFAPDAADEQWLVRLRRRKAVTAAVTALQTACASGM
ncbi:MAG TPA: hypothetical protein VE974_03200 [Thermoanaerobaculia bacterium]|nr:hypothetical protein [Thermoanaerobaculia bacterium]